MRRSCGVGLLGQNGCWNHPKIARRKGIHRRMCLIGRFIEYRHLLEAKRGVVGATYPSEADPLYRSRGAGVKFVQVEERARPAGR